MIAVFLKTPVINSLISDGIAIVFAPFELAMVQDEDYLIISMIVFPEQEYIEC